MSVLAGSLLFMLVEQSKGWHNVPSPKQHKVYNEFDLNGASP